MATQFRAGRYIKQPNRYSAFMPEALPPVPAISIDGAMQTMLSKADRALGRLDGSIQTLPDPDMFVFMYVRKEAVLSSQIEGTQSSLNDLLEAEAAIHDANRPSDVSEVLNYVRAMNYGLQRLAEMPISVRLIREIHEELMQNVRGNHANPGELRRSQNWIGPGGSTLNDAIFVPPPPHEVERLLSDLEKFVHDENDIPALIKIGLIHAQFETIHPFLDGNGRVGRLLIAFYLCQKEILLKPVLYLSHWFKLHRARYYELLQNIRDKGEWEEWTKFFLEGVASVSLEATETARKIVAMREEHRRNITDRFGRSAGNGLRVLESLYTHPFIDNRTVMEKLGISFPAAADLIDRFVEADLLVEITGQARYRVYQYFPDVRLFSDVGRS
jgi:Fic family protein